MGKRGAPKSRRSPSRVHFSLVDLLFGLVALNLIFVSFLYGALLLFISFEFGGFLFLFFDAREGVLHLLAVPAVVGIPILMTAAFYWLCWWAARGFIEIRPFRIAIATLGYLGYSAFAIKYDAIDGYVCAATIVFISLAVTAKLFQAQSNRA